MFGLFRHANRHAGAIASVLYGAIVAQARSPALYADLGVPDTVEGRFEMVVLHSALVLRRLRSESESGKAVGQEVFDQFLADMDRSLREMGVGDLAVPKRMKKMAEAFYGRSAAYDAALASPDTPALADAIRRNVFGGLGDAAAELAGYVVAAAAALDRAPAESILAGSPAFPDPAGFIVARNRA